MLLGSCYSVAVTDWNAIGLIIVFVMKLTMMGFCAVYAGLIYNDCFSLGLNLFGSRWEFEGQEYGSVEDGATAVSTAEYGSNDSVYPFGLDPVWHVTSNELLFFNSFKMKMSVIFGICQMFLYVLSLCGSE